MPADHIGQRRPQRPGIQLPGQPHRHRDVVDRRRALQLGHEPQPLLGKRQRHPPGPLPRRQRRPRRSRCRSRAASPAGVGASNSARTPTSTPSTARTRRTSRTASSECPPRSKKSSSGPTRSTPSTSANTPHRISSATVAGPAPPPPRRSPGPAAPPGPPSRSPSAAARPAPPPPPAPCTPAAAPPHAPAPPAASLPGRVLATSRRRRGPRSHQPPIPGHVLPDDHRRLRHPRMAASTASTSPGSTRNPRIFTWSSARPANTSCPPARPPHQVPGPVHPLPAAPNGHATNRSAGQPRPPQIPPRQPRPGHIQLPRHPRRHRPQPPVQHEHPRIRDRPPDRRRRQPATSAHRSARRITVASVGPYTLTSRRPGAAHAAASTSAGTPPRPPITSVSRGQPPPASSAPSNDQRRDMTPSPPPRAAEHRPAAPASPARPGRHHQRRPPPAPAPHLRHRGVKAERANCSTRIARPATQAPGSRRQPGSPRSRE